MKHILKALGLFLFVGCSSPKEKMVQNLSSHIRETFPDATFIISNEGCVYILTIEDHGNELDKEDEVETEMTEVLGNFYLSFHLSSASAPTNSQLKVIYSSDKISWRSRAYNLFELGEMYDLEIQ